MYNGESALIEWYSKNALGLPRVFPESRKRIRGEEWLSSVPLHLQLFDALGFERVQYAHIALLMKQEGASRRKLSQHARTDRRIGGPGWRAARRRHHPLRK